MRGGTYASVICLLVVTLVPGERAEAAPSGSLVIAAGPVTLTVSRVEQTVWRDAGGSALALANTWLRARSHRRGEGVAVRLNWTRASTLKVLGAAQRGAREMALPAAVARVTLAAPTFRQLHRNGCEATALSIALRGGVGRDALQRALPRAAPLVARKTPAGLVWGDPQLGFVGGADAAGYGVYDRPLLALARRTDPLARNLTGRPLASMLAALRDGHAVVAWVTLGPSEPFTWRTPQGRLVHADHAEHAIALTGWTRNLIAYNDPWDGKRKQMAVADLAARWLPLGRRAISLAARRIAG